ncbi:MAG TPA: DinB family protein [Verrucomicrobiae bacterium]|nr:DinB family protein [Verrucomicrobiae bacterium]
MPAKRISTGKKKAKKPPRIKVKPPRDSLVDSLLNTYAINDAMNQLVLAHLNPRAWRAAPPNQSPREGRTIAAIFAHLHNCRLVWLRHSAPHLRRPAPLDPARCTMAQARRAHRQSAAQCLEMLRQALDESSPRRVEKFSRGDWAPVWPASGVMFCYIFLHEAHHRGQVIMLAHQLGYRLPVPGAYGVWHWQKLWKAAGMPQPG